MLLLCLRGQNRDEPQRRRSSTDSGNGGAADDGGNDSRGAKSNGTSSGERDGDSGVVVRRPRRENTKTAILGQSKGARTGAGTDLISTKP
jgi:hypothetical protein